MHCEFQIDRAKIPVLNVVSQSKSGQEAGGSVNMIIFLLQDFCQKNTEHMRPEAVSLLRSSGHSFVHHLVASSPEALFRWGVLRATIRIIAAFKIIGRRRAELSRLL